MDYEAYHYLFMGFGIASALMFVLSVILFFKLKISRVIEKLTGKTVKKSQSKKAETLASAPAAGSGTIGKTSKIYTSESTSVLQESEGTTFLADSPDGTTLLETEPPVVVTAPLNNANTDLGTTVLSSVFAVIYDITYIHTNEVIE